MTSLDAKLTAALNSREARHIRRRLPDPSTPTDSNLIDFNSNDYLSLSRSPVLRKLFLSKLLNAPDVLGSGGSRLLVNGQAHNALESRLTCFFRSPCALLFNSGFDANVSFFTCVPQPGDVVVHDEYIHASVVDGIRASRLREAYYPFTHNSMSSFRRLLSKLKHDRPELVSGQSSVFVAVESLYSMDGTFAPLTQIVDILNEFFAGGNAHLVVDEAHATGIYGPQGRGVVAMLGLEDKVLARLHTFGKALAGTGAAVIVTNTLIRDYLLNYARPLIYTTSLSYANIIAADCSFDMLEDGRAERLATNVLELSTYFCRTLRPRLLTIPSGLLSLPPHLQTVPPQDQDKLGPLERQPSPIIPIMTCQPRPLSAFLHTRGMNARPITWPTVPKGKDRVRVCLHAGNTSAEVDRLVDAIVEWAEGVVVGRVHERRQAGSEAESKSVGVSVESKL